MKNSRWRSHVFLLPTFILLMPLGCGGGGGGGSADTIKPATAASTAEVDPFWTSDNVFAHHGLFLTENTIPSIETAQARGFTHVELDIVRVGDGSFAAFHDRDLSRVSGQAAKVCSLSLEELKAQPLGSFYFDTRFGFDKEFSDALLQLPDPWVTQISAARVPSLDEIFRQFGNQLVYLLDIKTLSCDDDDTGGAEALLALVDQAGVAENVYFESEDAALLPYVKAAAGAPAKAAGQEVFAPFAPGKMQETVANSVADINAAAGEVDFLITDLDLFTSPSLDDYTFFNQQAQLVKICHEPGCEGLAEDEQFFQLKEAGQTVYIDRGYEGLFADFIKRTPETVQ